MILRNDLPSQWHLNYRTLVNDSYCNTRFWHGVCVHSGQAVSGMASESVVEYLHGKDSLPLGQLAVWGSRACSWFFV